MQKIYIILNGENRKFRRDVKRTITYDTEKSIIIADNNYYYHEKL